MNKLTIFWLSGLNTRSLTIKQFYHKTYQSVLVLLLLGFINCSSENRASQPEKSEPLTGASQIEAYLPLIKGKSVGLVVNQTAVVGNKHLVDTLLSHGVKIKRIFAPEHGFRGELLAGDVVNDTIDPKTGIPVMSLYGKNKKPDASQVSDIDVMIFDIQDVGARFYTFISTMHYIMESCAENHKQLIILDRPNPNGDQVDGPVLDTAYRSFVGMHPIPVVHGLTVGELARMINGERWLTSSDTCNLTVIKVKNYTHQTLYRLPIAPSPSLPNYLSVRLYTSLCFFEATDCSVGRGTAFPFQVIGYPDPSFGDFKFTPEVNRISKIQPIAADKTCYGIDLQHLNPDSVKFTLSYIIDFYKKYKDSGLPGDLFSKKRWINLLAGNDRLATQIEKGLSETEIRQSWVAELKKYNEMRRKYLLYPE